MRRTLRWPTHALLVPTGSPASTSVALPAAFLDHLRTKGYHSRSNKHSNALAIAVVEDLVSACAALARHAIKGEATFDLNFNVHAQTTVWNTDLVIGRPPSPVVPTNDTM